MPPGGVLQQRDDAARNVRREVLVGGLLAAAFCLFAWRSWRAWPDILVDFGHELYLPWRMSAGEALYRDLPFTMGPLSQHFNALLFQIFGVSLTTLIAANLTILAGITALLYWLFRRCGTRGSAATVVLFFLAVFAFAQTTFTGQIGNYNYVCPYRHEMTHGLALGLAHLACLVRYFDHRRSGWLIAAGVLLGLVTLTKAEMVLPAAGCSLFAVLLLARIRNPAATASGTITGPPESQTAAGGLLTAIRSLGVLLVSALAPIGMAVCLLTRSLGWDGAWRGALGYWQLTFDPALTTRSGFYRAVAGWDRPLENAISVALVTLAIGAAVVLGYLSAMLLAGRRRSWLWAGLLGLVAGYSSLWLIPPEQWLTLPAALPLVLSIVLAVAIRSLWNRPSPAESSLPLALLAAYALGLLPKILLAATLGHYGFVLAMPGTLVLMHWMIHDLPARLDRSRLSGAGFRGLALGLFGACALVQFLNWERIDQTKTLAIGAGGDRFFAAPQMDDRVLPTAATLDYLQQNMADDETLVVIPEGATLNYLLRKRNPSGFLMINPWEFQAHGGESVVVDAIMRSPPDYFVLVSMDMSIHGGGNFGDPQFGQSLRAWIEREYQVVDGHASRTPDGRVTFQSIVYRRQ
ncbi:MAG: hypothetical protein ACKV0T_03515 [Planctomycetales bacterium]